MQLESRPGGGSVTAGLVTILSRTASGFAGSLQGRELGAGVPRQITPQPNDAGIVLIQHLVFLDARLQTGQHFAILLQYSPVPLLNLGLV